jgi:hypothetical protein
MRHAHHTVDPVALPDNLIAPMGERCYRAEPVPPHFMSDAFDTLARDVVRLSELDRDLFEQDLQRSEELCFHKHCDRIWMRLTPEQRDLLRERVRAEDPPLARHSQVIGFAATQKIGAILREASGYRSEPRESSAAPA